MSNAQRSRALFLVLLLTGSVLPTLLFAGAGAQETGDPDVPVPYAKVPSVDSVALRLWREGTPCNGVDAGETADLRGTCSLRVTDLPSSVSPEPSRETFTVRAEPPEGGEGLNDASTARFLLDTVLSSEESVEGAQYPFTIRNGQQALQYDFWYQSESACAFGVGQELLFTVRVSKAASSDLTGATPFAEDTVDACSISTFSSTAANRISGAIGLDNPVEVAQGELLVMEIFAVSAQAAPGVTWTLLFADNTYPSSLVVRTDQAIEFALWATDKAGKFKTTFDPNAPESEAFLVGRLAVRSPFGASALARAYTAEIQAPSGALVDLNPDGDLTDPAVRMVEIESLSERSGSRTVWKFAQPNDFPEQPWHYKRAGVPAPELGSYELRVKSTLLGQTRLMTRAVAMGAFDFTLQPVQGETVNHQLNRGSSTTFILALANGASVTDTYEVKAAFDFASRNLVWTVQIQGVDQRDRITLDPGEIALLQVKITPPGNAQNGDAARVKVTARSLGSTAQKVVNLEGQVSTLTVRDVGIVPVRTGAFNVGIDRDNTVQLFVWNRGTAVDSFTANIVDGSLTPNDQTKFRVTLNQTRFDNVDPGAIAPIPIRVTTTDQVTGGDTFTFKVRAQSVAQPAETVEATVETVVEAVRDFDFFALLGTNDRATRSLRYAKWNMSDANTTNPASFCEADLAVNNPEQCGEYIDFAYHRFTIRNTGDQPETYPLDLVGERTTPTQGCSRVLPDRISLNATGFVAGIDHGAPGTETLIEEVSAAPGETKAFYLRVVANAHDPVYQPATFPVSVRCNSESFHAGVKVALEGVPARTLETETQWFHALPEDNDFPSAGRALVSLDDRSTTSEGLFAPLPSHVGVKPETDVTIPFTVTNQAGHEDQLEVRLGPRNLVQGLLDANWTIELVPLENVPANVTDGGRTLIVPRDAALGPSAPAGIGHATGVDFPLGLKVNAPITGVEENQRFTFALEAVSTFNRSVKDTLGITVQIGEDFAFEVSRGRDTIEAHPGDTVAFAVNVANIGASRDRYTISAGAPASFNVPQVTPSTLEISPGSGKAASVVVAVPPGASPGSAATIPVTVTNRGDPATEADDVVRELTYTIEIRPEGTLSVSADPQVVTIGPGGQVSLNFTVANGEASDRQVRLREIFAPPGFTTTLSGVPAVDGDVRQVPADGSIQFTYLVRAPASIVEGSRYTFVVRAEDADNEDNFANGVAFAVVAGTAAVSLEPEDTRLVVDRGGKAVFNVLVRNTGSSLAWFQVTPEFQSTGWTSRVLDQDGGVITNATVRVAEKSFKRVGIEVTAPASVAKDHVERITLRAAAVGQAGVGDEVTLTAPIHDFDLRVVLEGPSTKDAAPGDDLEYLFSITNQGNGVDRVRLSFEDPEGEDPIYQASTDLADATTPEIAPGETLSGVRVVLEVPSPNQAPVPVPQGVVTIIRATSAGTTASDAPTVTTSVTTKLLPYVRFDVDGDGAFELAVDRNRNTADGFESFEDKDDAMVERGELAQAEAVASDGLFAIDGDDDGRTEHLVDTDGDGIGEQYFDPDKAQSYAVPYTIDANQDAEPEHPIDGDFDGLIDGVYDPDTETVHETVEADFAGSGRRQLLIDTDDDGEFDTYVDPHQSPQLVTEVTKRGDRYHIDTDGDGKTDTYYNAETQSITDATSANLQDFLKDYWYFLLLFLAVVVLFGVIVFRRL